MAKKTGPKTPQGIANSSQNAATHNMTSNRSLIQNETQADLDAHRSQWHLQYPTTNEIAHRLVTRAANSEWHLLRLERQFEAIASHLLAQPVADWPAADHSLYQNIQRYLTTAQRAHHRDRLSIQQYRAELRAEEARLTKQPSEPSEDPTEGLLLPLLNQEPAPSDMPLVQNITITLDDNDQPRAWLTPTTAEILLQTDNVFETTRVIRCLQFHNRHVPPVYQWANARIQAAPPGSNEIFLHMTAKSFRIAVERENGGPVQFWQDLDDLDKPILASTVKGPPCQPRESK